MLLQGWFLLLLIAASDGSCLIFRDGSPGYAQLEEVPVFGSITASLSFRTGSTGGLLLLMRELTAGQNISLSLSRGSLHLQVYPDNLLIPVNEDTSEAILYNDNKWHSVTLTIISRIKRKFILLKIDDFTMTTFVQNLPLTANTKYETFIGGLPPRLSLGRSAGSGDCSLDYVGSIRDSFVMDEGVTQDTSVFLGAALAGDCLEETKQSSLVFTGSMIGVVTQNDGVGSVILNIRAEDEDKIGQGAVLYELLENPHDYFSLDQNSGQLSIAQQLDREALRAPNNLLFLTVRVSQDGSDKSSTGMVTVLISDRTGQQDCVCGQKNFFISVKKNIL